MLSRAVPVFDESIILFTREEKKGYLTIVSKKDPSGYKIINPTTREIIRLCDGSNDIGQIYNILKKRYPDVQPRILKRDLHQTLIILERDHYIKWKNDFNPFVVSQSSFEVRIDVNTRVVRATESDIDIILNFVNACIEKNERQKTNGYINVITSPLVRLGLYKELLLRFRLFNYSERFYFLRKNDQSVGILGVYDDYPMSYRNFVSILGLKESENLCVDIKHLFKAAITDLKKQSSKIKCSLFSTQKHVEIYDMCLREIGFIKEGVLKNEYENGIDEWLYGKLL